MGYYTYISGDLKIEPPLNLSKLPDHLGSADESYFLFSDVPGDEDVQVIDGEITVVGTRPGHTDVTLNFDESVKAYDFNDHVQELVNQAKAQGCVVNGEFDGDGEESEDFWRLKVENNELTTESGSILFPSDIKHERATAWKQAHDELCTAMACLHKNPYGDPA